MFLAAAGLAGLAGCQSESPFGGEQEGTGRVLTSGLGVELKGEQALTRAGADVPSVDDFTVDFVDADGVVAESYLYGQLPEIVTLKTGSYTVRAYYGDNPAAAFDAPYYLGNSEKSFSVTNGNVTEIKDPVVCKLANVRVTVQFDASLAAAMSANSYAVAKMGNGAELPFYQSTTGSGYFAYVENSNTLTTTFVGVVDGEELVETRTFTNVQPGNHYKITFKLHNAEAGDPGFIDPTNPDHPGEGPIHVEADITVNDLTGENGGNLEPDEPTFDNPDNDRPQEGGGDDPVGPVDPVDPSGPAPTIVGLNGIVLGSPIEVPADGMECRLEITSVATGGIEEFIVTIDSETLTEDVLTSVGLAKQFSLVTPGIYEEGLSGLGLPVGDAVKGQSKVTFDITNFMSLLGVYGAATHEFKLSVTDANGNNTSTLILVTK